MSVQIPAFSTPFLRRSRAWLFLALRLLGLASRVTAEPYVPRSDDEIIERLPAGFRRSQARQDQEDLANDPENLRESLALARSYLETARAEGEGRFVGFAQAVLAPWWDRDPTPDEVRLLRARVRSSLWAFDQAARDLDILILGNTNQAAARWQRFDIAMAQGDWALARRIIDQAPAAEAASTPGILARARWSGRKGEAASARASVSVLLGSLGADRVRDRHEALGLLAELALQDGRSEEARRHFEAQRRVGVRDIAATVAFAEFLLDIGEPAAVVEVAHEAASVPAVAVRLVAALDLLARDDPSPALRERRRALAEEARRQLEAQERRGDPSGLPDSVFYWLRIGNRPGEAVREARDLWALRRTSSDVRRVLEAAVGARDVVLAGQVMDWITSHSLTDARWSELLRKAEAMR